MPFPTDADDNMYTYHIEYRFNGEPRTYLLELKDAQLTEHDAAMHLLQLHLGDAENSLVMPTADSTPELLKNLLWRRIRRGHDQAVFGIAQM